MIENDSVVPARENLCYHLVSCHWLAKWERYTSSQSLSEKKHPGPINSKEELDFLIHIDKRQFFFKQDFFYNMHLKSSVKEDVHFKVVNDTVWRKLYTQYGGQDLPRVSVSVPTDVDEKLDFIVEVQHRRFKIGVYPGVRYVNWKSEEPVSIYASRSSTVRELRAKACEAIHFERGNSDYCPSRLMALSRLIKLEGDSIDDLKEGINSWNSKSSPVDIQARILEDHLLIGDANIGDDEVIVLEWRISFDKLSQTPFAFMPTSKKRAVR